MLLYCTAVASSHALRSTSQRGALRLQRYADIMELVYDLENGLAKGEPCILVWNPTPALRNYDGIEYKQSGERSKKLDDFRSMIQLFGKRK